MKILLLLLMLPTFSFASSGQEKVSDKVQHCQWKWDSFIPLAGAVRVNGGVWGFAFWKFLTTKGEDCE